MLLAKFYLSKQNIAWELFVLQELTVQQFEKVKNAKKHQRLSTVIPPLKSVLSCKIPLVIQ